MFPNVIPERCASGTYPGCLWVYAKGTTKGPAASGYRVGPTLRLPLVRSGAIEAAGSSP